MRSLTAQWSVIITLETPKEEIELKKKLETFETTMNKVFTKMSSLNATQMGWTQRIRTMKQTMTLPSPIPTDRQLVKRGLLDIISEVSKYLFGMATDADVQEVRSHLLNLTQQNKRIAHNFGNLMTVVKHDRKYLTENRQHINDIENFIGLLQNQTDAIDGLTRIPILDLTSLCIHCRSVIS